MTPASDLPLVHHLVVLARRHGGEIITVKTFTEQWYLVFILIAVGIFVDVTPELLEIVLEVDGILDVAQHHHDVHFLLPMVEIRWVTFERGEFAVVPGSALSFRSGVRALVLG